MAFVACQVQRGQLTNFGSILRLNEGIFLLLITGFFLLRIDVRILVNVAGVSIILEQESDYVLVAVTSSQQ